MVGSLALWRAVHTVRQISDTEVERSTVAFYVEQDSTYESLDELEGNELGILAELDRSQHGCDITANRIGIRDELCNKGIRLHFPSWQMPCGKGKWRASCLTRRSSRSMRKPLGTRNSGGTA